MSVKERLVSFIKHKGISVRSFEKLTGLSFGYVNNIRVSIQPDKVESIAQQFPDLNTGWLLTGNGQMLNSSEEKSEKSDVNIIPFFDDISSIGGSHSLVSEPNIAYKPTEYINAGDWFREATAAIRHYGDSMEEYPSGCILAIKEVTDKNLLVWGKDYVIETSEYRITKRVQKGDKKGYIKAYSTNKETYPDGRQIHEPLDVPIDEARFLLVLGYVVKKNGGTMIFSNKQ